MDWTKLTDQVGKIKVKNVVDMPLFYALWVLAIAVISAACRLHEWITITLFCFAAVLLFLAAFGYFFFTFKNPDYLRSEEYHLRKQSLEILGDKENLLPVNPQNIVDVSNPYNSTMEDGTIETQDDV